MRNKKKATARKGTGASSSSLQFVPKAAPTPLPLAIGPPVVVDPPPREPSPEPEPPPTTTPRKGPSGPRETGVAESDDDDNVILDDAPQQHPLATKRVDRRPFVAGIGGTEIFFDKHYVCNGRPTPNWIIRCSQCPPHKKCERSRKGSVNHKTWGDIEVPAFLFAWATKVPPPDTGASHRSLNPTQAMTNEIVAGHRAALEDLVENQKRA